MVRDFFPLSCRPHSRTTDDAPPARFMDVSKQVIGSVLVHLANLLLSLLSSGTFTTEPMPTAVVAGARLALRRRHAGAEDGGSEGHHSNPCSFYLLNLGIDVCALLFLLYFFAYSRPRVSSHLCSVLPPFPETHR